MSCNQLKFNYNSLFIYRLLHPARSTCASLLTSIIIYYYFSVLSISHITFVIVTIQSTSCTSYIHEIHVVVVSFFSSQRTQKSIIFHSRNFSYGFQRNLYKCTVYTSFSLLKNLSFFSKLDLSFYLSYYMLSIIFYLKNYCIFIIVYQKSLSNPAATHGESCSTRDDDESRLGWRSFFPSDAVTVCRPTISTRTNTK